MGAPIPKALVRLAGQPMLVRSAATFARAPSVHGVVAVVPEEAVEEASRLLDHTPKIHAVVAGGQRRQDSVLEGLKQAPDAFGGIVLVHDAARPLVDVPLIEAVIRAARQVGAALPVLAMSDTVKRVREGRVVETLDREGLAGAQTPQGFAFELLVRAYQEAFRDQVTLTDEAMAVERLGEPVATVPGSIRNRKITTQEDLDWAEDLLARENGGGSGDAEARRGGGNRPGGSA